MAERPAPRRLPVGLLAAAALVAAVASVARREPAPRAAPSVSAAAPASGAAPAVAPDDGAPARPTHADPPRIPGLPARGEPYARAAVDAWVDAAGLGDAVSPTDRETLVAALGRLRVASRWMQRHPRARGDREARHRAALLEADRVFRETLGVGVGQFVASLAAPGTIDDLGAARQ